MWRHVRTRTRTRTRACDSMSGIQHRIVLRPSVASSIASASACARPSVQSLPTNTMTRVWIHYTATLNSILSDSSSTPRSDDSPAPPPQGSSVPQNENSQLNADSQNSKFASREIKILYFTSDDILREEERWLHVGREKLTHIRPMQRKLIKMFDEVLANHSDVLSPTVFVRVLRALRVWPHENRETAARVFGAYHRLRKECGLKANSLDDTVVYNAMLQFLCRAHLPHECAKLLTNMKRYEKKASAALFSDAVANVNALPDEDSYQPVMTAFVAAAAVADDTSLNLDPKSDKSSETALDPLLVEATKLWKEVLTKFSGSISPELYTNALWMYSKYPIGSGLSRCMSIVDEMRSKGMKIEAEHWNAVHNAALVARNYSFMLDGADSVQNLIPTLEPSSSPVSTTPPALKKAFPLLNLLISALSETGRVEEAYRYVQLFEGHGVTLQLETYHRFTRAVDKQLQKENETAGMMANSSELHKALAAKADSLTQQLLGLFMQEASASTSADDSPRRAHLQAEVLGAANSRVRSIMYFLLRAGRQHYVYEHHLKVVGKGNQDSSVSASRQAAMHAFAKLLWDSDLIFVTNYAGGADKLCNGLRSEVQLEPTRTVVKTTDSRGQSFVIRVSSKELHRWLKTNLTFLERKLSRFASILE